MYATVIKKIIYPGEDIATPTIANLCTKHSKYCTKHIIIRHEYLNSNTPSTAIIQEKEIPLKGFDINAKVPFHT